MTWEDLEAQREAERLAEELSRPQDEQRPIRDEIPGPSGVRTSSEYTWARPSPWRVEFGERGVTWHRERDDSMWIWTERWRWPEMIADSGRVAPTGPRSGPMCGFGAPEVEGWLPEGFVGGIVARVEGRGVE